MVTMTAVDLGAQSGRVAVGRFDGTRIDVEVVHRFPNVPVELHGRLCWDILGLYREVLDGIRAGGRVDSIGVDSWAVDFGLLDRSGNLVANPVHYRDRRRAGALDQVLAQIPARALYERTGIQILPINTIYELAAMSAEHDPALASAETLLMIPDLVHYWLAGAGVGEWTNATTTQCLDARSGAWDGELLQRVGVSPALMPELVAPGTALGDLAADVARQTGVGSPTVVAVGTHDTASAVAAVPFRDSASVFISAGTWSLVGCELEAALITDATFAANLTNEGGVGGMVRLLRNVTGLWLLHECRRAWAEAGRTFAFEELIALAEDAAPLRSLIDPDDGRFATSGDMPARIREFCTDTRQPEPIDPGAVTRCILESLSLKHADAVAQLAAATGTRPAEIHVVGGGARNDLLCRWTAEASGLPVLVGPEEATLLGNLLVQAICLGEIGSIADARDVVRASFAPGVHEPTASDAWQAARGRFSEIVAAATSEVVA
jgi:rhamnulokinase